MLASTGETSKSSSKVAKSATKSAAGVESAIVKATYVH